MQMTPEEKKALFKSAKRKLVHKTKHFEYVCDEVILPDKTPYEYNIVIHPGASVIIPTDDDGKLIFVKQYRPPIDDIAIEFPAGKIDEGEDPKDTAIRELQEEAGKYPGTIEKILTIHPAASYTTETLYFYLAKDLRDQVLPQDELESIEVVKLSLEEALQMVKNGKITDAKTALGILYYEKYC